MRCQQWAFYALQEPVPYKAEKPGVIVETVKPQYTNQQYSNCGCTLKPERPTIRVSDKYGTNANYNAAENVARKLALQLQRADIPPGGVACQHALQSEVMTVNAPDMASDIPVSAEREASDRPPADSAVGFRLAIL